MKWAVLFLFLASTTAFGAEISQELRQAWITALEGAESQYDPSAKMVKEDTSKVSPHTALRDAAVHPTRESLAYAARLLKTEEPHWVERAREILETVIALQDQDPVSRTYGLWPLYLEEPLDDMPRPDFNWADFCGVRLLEVWMDSRDLLGEELTAKVGDAIVHAARSIERRNVGPDYTNIAIMGTYVTLATAEQFELEDLREYAMARARHLHDHVMQQGSFTEYNSPTYTQVAIEDLARGLRRFQDEEAKRLFKDLYDLAWKHVALHFHPPTRQWAGPHSRCYQTDLRDRRASLRFLEKGTGCQEVILKDQYRAVDCLPKDVLCPEEYLHYFKELPEPRTVVENYTHPSRRLDPEGLLVPQRGSVIGTTYLHPKYTLGTVNSGEFWNQRRCFLAYWGTVKEPAYLHVRFLHDGYDYSSAMIFTEQSEGRALSAVCFKTDGGDTHRSPSIDRIKNATIRAKDLRLRFEFGSAEHLQIDPIDASPSLICARDREVVIQVRPLVSRFDRKPFRWEVGGDDKIRWVDAVAYEGEERAFNFSEIEEAFLAFAFSLSTPDQIPSMDALLERPSTDRFRVSWNALKTTAQGTVPSIEMPVKPVKGRELQQAFCGAGSR